VLEAVTKEASSTACPPTPPTADGYHRCRSCDQIYWKGSHFERMQELISRVLETE
jgi:uncharacterized protein with PIN domain